MAAQAAPAQTTTRAYVLDDVWLLPDITHPGQPAQPMTGAFEWTYVPGDFENGSGEFTELVLPWYGSNFQSLDINIDLTSIEITLPGNYHNLGVDVTLRLLQPLSPADPSTLDTVLSMFDIEVGISHRGHVVSGSVVHDLYVEFCGPAPANSTGLGGVAAAQGSKRVTDNDVLLEASSLPTNQFGYFLASRTQGFVQNPGGSQGNLCLGGTIARFARPGEVGFTGAVGEFSLVLDLGSFPTSPPSAVAPGEEWSFQAWFRDHNPGPTSNFTQGIAIGFQ